MWQYAIRAVKSDLRAGRGLSRRAVQRQYQQRRQRYIQLHSAKLEQLHQGSVWGAPALAQVQAELQLLERQLSAADILLFRSLAEAALVEHSGSTGAPPAATPCRLPHMHCCVPLLICTIYCCSTCARGDWRLTSAGMAALAVQASAPSGVGMVN